jgi:hypothetical protein
MPILCLCQMAGVCQAQDKAKNTFGKVSPADFVLPSTPIIDSNANAVILSDFGSVHFVGNKKGWFSHVFKKDTRIRIVNRKGFGAATITIYLRGQEENAEVLGDIRASAFNQENGQVLETKLDPKDIFTTRIAKKGAEVKFSVPGVKEGSVIEYTYTITSNYNYFLRSWQFQHEQYPCLLSDFQVEIPQTLFYVISRKGVHGYAIDKGSEGHEDYRLMWKSDNAMVTGEDQTRIVSAITVKHEWAMKDVEAFGTETYLTTPNNYMDQIDFQLSKTYNGEDYQNVTNTWATANDELLKDESFGGVLDQDNDWLDELSGKIGATDTDPLARAKAVYYYVTSHFTCTNHYNIYVTTNLSDVVRKNSGTVGDINLLLIALFRRLGWQADPVVLSTREYGFNLASYPLLERLNYVVARLKMDGVVYYLDAARPQLGFGQLADNCYNGHSRIISRKDSGAVWFEADSLKESRLTMVLLSSTDKGLEGTWQSTMGKQGSYEVRREVAEHGEKEYFKDIQTAFGQDVEISNGDIDSLTRLEDPVTARFDFLMKPTGDASLIYFDPIIWDGWRRNPFVAAERKYPVEMPYALDQTYIFSMEIPEGYIVDELPKSAKVSYNGNDGIFEYLIAQSGDRIQMRCRLKMNKAWFAPEEYSSLRDFFGFVVKKENEQIVLKKK